MENSSCESISFLTAFLSFPVRNTYHRASTATSFSASELGPRETNTPQIFQERHFGINCVEGDFGPVEIKPNGVVPVLGQFREGCQSLVLLS